MKDPSPTVTEEFDSIGVVLTPQRSGKYKAERIFIDGDAVVKREEITRDRQIVWAHRIASDDLEQLQTDLSRGKVRFREPKQLELRLGE